MSPIQVQKIIVGTFAGAWGIAFVASFVLGGIGFLGDEGVLGSYSVLMVFLFGQMIAGLFAVSGAIVASFTESTRVRRMANVPLAGTGVVALCALSLTAFLVLLT